ncbi:hypothetical protein ACJMK2_006649 [Sinanodonta woodiana]|uniref:Uncharacterized protein n=1 Tax=Sinanodonta woodiana TaxID=1069815 RepID=A0ABD3VV58_SINWO
MSFNPNQKRIELHLDVKTRWNSFPTMLEVASNRIQSAGNDGDIGFDALKTLLKAMEPVKLVFKNLSRDDATYMIADTILEFMFKKLSNLKNDISIKLMGN